MPRHWLIKSEPQVYSLQQLARDRITGWEGVRNYQARNFLRDEMAKGDRPLLPLQRDAPRCGGAVHGSQQGPGGPLAV